MLNCKESNSNLVIMNRNPLGPSVVNYRLASARFGPVYRSKLYIRFEPPTMSQPPKLLLCIEDDEDDQAFIEEAATETDPKLVFVAKSNGREALIFLNSQKEQHQLPCLILLDINMPLMSGKETLVAIKKDPALKNIPVVVFTTSSSKADQVFCEHYGADMVTKPVRPLDLKRVIEHVVLSRCV